MKEHGLIVTCLLLAYFIANVVMAVRINVFALARGRKGKLILYTLSFLLEGSIIMLGIGLIAAMRRLDNDSA
jgi:hypothetical protein